MLIKKWKYQLLKKKLSLKKEEKREIDIFNLKFLNGNISCERRESKEKFLPWKQKYHQIETNGKAQLFSNTKKLAKN